MSSKQLEIRFAEDVKVLKEAVCERLRDILHNGNIVQTDNEIKQLIEELERDA